MTNISRRLLIQGLLSTLLYNPKTLLAKCPDTIDLELQIKHDSNDWFSEVFFHPSDSGIQKALTSTIIEPVEMLYGGYLRFSSIRVVEYGEHSNKPYINKKISVVYASIDDFLQTELSEKEIFMFLEEMHPEYKAEIEQSLAEYQRTRNREIFLEAYAHARTHKEAIVLGTAIPEKRRIYLFPRHDAIENLKRYNDNANFVAMGYARSLGAVLTHELGHIFGLEHSNSPFLPNGIPDIMSLSHHANMMETLGIIYGFSEANKQQLKRMCK